MSDLRPKGVTIVLDGIERELLFTLNAIDAIQSKYGMTVFAVLKRITDQNSLPETIKDMLSILLTDEAERAHWKNPDSTLPAVSEKEAGWLVTIDNLSEVTDAIFEAYRISIPDPDEDTDPNRTSSPKH